MFSLHDLLLNVLKASTIVVFSIGQTSGGPLQEMITESYEPCPKQNACIPASVHILLIIDLRDFIGKKH